MRSISGVALLDGVDILTMTPDERAKAGLFLAMQYPVEVPGVSMTNFLRTAKTEIDGKAPAIRQWTKDLSGAMQKLRMDPKFAQRSVNEGFSGGEKKRAEVLQLELLKPKFAVLDETDSGLDVDALRIVSEGVNRAKENSGLGDSHGHPLHPHPQVHQARHRACIRGRSLREDGRP
jgi:Fe-S cluster assembly ATP-binding protein